LIESDLVISVDEFRSSARHWLTTNLSAAPADSPEQGPDRHRLTPEYLAAQRQAQRRLYDAGYAGISWPIEYGGRGLSEAHERAFRLEASGFATPNLGVSYSTTFGVCAPTLLAHASEEFKRIHIPAILRGEELWAQFFSEPGAGSDLAGVTTRAERRCDSWVINGAKLWSSGAQFADYGLCLTRTDRTQGKHKGLTWFAVPVDAHGLTIRPVVFLDGTTRFCEEFFDDVRVPDSHRVGAVGDGWTVARTMLGFERDSGIDRNGVTVDPGPFAPDLVSLARRVGRETDPLVRQLIARSHMYDYIRTQLAARAESLLGRDYPPMSSAAYAKLAIGLYNPLHADASRIIAGHTALAWHSTDSMGPAAGRTYLLGRSMSVAGGTNEMQRNTIAERILGLPREPYIDPFLPSAGDDSGRI
jgi:alkylation response protein AidB-like acyl-CoA dehydrogenase